MHENWCHGQILSIVVTSSRWNEKEKVKGETTESSFVVLLLILIGTPLSFYINPFMEWCLMSLGTQSVIAVFSYKERQKLDKSMSNTLIDGHKWSSMDFTTYHGAECGEYGDFCGRYLIIGRSPLESSMCCSRTSPTEGQGW